MTKGENRIGSYSAKGYELSPDVNNDAPNDKAGSDLIISNTVDKTQ